MRFQCETNTSSTPSSAKAEVAHNRPSEIQDLSITAAIAGGCFAVLAFAFGLNFWVTTAIGLMVGVAGVAGLFWFKETQQRWRERPLEVEDIAKLREFLILAEQAKYRLPPLPSSASKLTNGELQNWADTAHEEIQKQYEALIISGCDLASRKLLADLQLQDESNV